MEPSSNLTDLFNNNPEEDNKNNIYEQDSEGLTLTISEIMKANTQSYTTMIEIYKKIEGNFTPYPNKDEIPILKIKNEDFLISGEKITSHIYEQFKNDDKFNKCKICKKNDNTFFCEICKKNICERCSNENSCENENKHDISKLIKLTDLKNKALNNKLEIKKFFLKNVNDSEEDSKPISLTWDIILMKNIIEKDYNNYFHYQNIFECYEYFQIYKEIYSNSCLRISYSVNKEYIGKEKDYKIFGKEFVENNKDKLILTVNGKKSLFSETVKIDNGDLMLEVNLILKSKSVLKDLSYMFCECKSKSIEISGIENRKLLDLREVTNISKMFKNCSYLTKAKLFFLYLSNKIESIDYLFSGCEELTEIFYIESLNTKLVKRMNSAFNLCKKIQKLDGVGGFKTANVEYFDEMFKDCSALKELPKEISNWTMKNAKSLEGMFKGCSSLEKIPNIDLWNVTNVKSMKEMFSGCKKLKELPDLKNWNLVNLEFMQRMFFECKKLIYEKKIIIENLFKISNFEKIDYEDALGDKE